MYSLTLHDENGDRLVGFDNAHAAPSRKGRSRRVAHDHRHRLRAVRPYEYQDAATLLEDFWVRGRRRLERMRRLAMSTLYVGIATLEEYKARTLAIARGELKTGPKDPKIWFNSIESFAKVLSERNRELLGVIAETKPASLQELAERTGRAKSNLSRTLKTMERYGLVAFERGNGRNMAPRTPNTHLVLDLSLRAVRQARRTLVPA
jgi:predicted transcriptional regulator